MANMANVNNTLALCNQFDTLIIDEITDPIEVLKNEKSTVRKIKRLAKKENVKQAKSEALIKVLSTQTALCVEVRRPTLNPKLRGDIFGQVEKKKIIRRATFAGHKNSAGSPQRVGQKQHIPVLLEYNDGSKVGQRWLKAEPPPATEKSKKDFKLRKREFPPLGQ